MEVHIDNPDKIGIHAKKNSMDHRISYNSDIFGATDLKFCIEVCIDHPKKCASMKRKICMEIHAKKFHVPWN